jgi:type II secretory pathway pseudopilin PulG
MGSVASAHESVVVIGIIAVLLGIGIRVYFWYINQEQ